MIALLLPMGAHHLDLMFEDPADPPSSRRLGQSKRHTSESGSWTRPQIMRTNMIFDRQFTLSEPHRAINS